MRTYKLGVVGTGVMGEAIINGALMSKALTAENIFVYDIDESKLKGMVNRYSICTCTSVEELILKSDIILLAVKPNTVEALLDRVADKARGKAFLSIVTGWKSAKIMKHLREDTRLMCVMPNMPAICGEGMSVLSANHTLTPDEFRFAQALFGSFGETEVLDEKYFNIVTGLSGSGPAFMFMFIEAMMSAGIYRGLPQKVARKLAVQTALGAAKALKMNERHPADMRDAVCTPGGTTIEGVFELENGGLNGLVMSAIVKSADKFSKMEMD